MIQNTHGKCARAWKILQNTHLTEWCEKDALLTKFSEKSNLIEISRARSTPQMRLHWWQFNYGLQHLKVHIPRTYRVNESCVKLDRVWKNFYFVSEKEESVETIWLEDKHARAVTRSWGLGSKLFPRNKSHSRLRECVGVKNRNASFRAKIKNIFSPKL